MGLSKTSRSGMRRRWQPSGWWTWRVGSRAANWTHNGSTIDDGRAGTRPPSTKGESSVIITARACPVPPHLLAQALSRYSTGEGPSCASRRYIRAAASPTMTSRWPRESRRDEPPRREVAGAQRRTVCAATVAGRTRPAPLPLVERLAAGAGAAGVGVVDGEAGLLDAVEEEGIAQAGAAARLDRDAQGELTLGFAGEQLTHLGSRALGQAYDRGDSRRCLGHSCSFHIRPVPGGCAAMN